MDAVHIHLFLNHLPVLGSVFATALLAYALIRRNDEVARLALLLLVLCALVAIPVFLTGEPAEETVEKIAGVGESFIEEHEDAAKFAFWTMIITGIAGAVGLFLNLTGNRVSRMAGWLVLVLGVASAGLMLRTANLGGQIRHSEIRAGGATAVGSESRETRNDRREDDD